jgi:RHS repeat-associated protein
LTVNTATNRISGYCYDANGNLLAEFAPPCPSPTYRYDAENRLVNYHNGGALYTYDGAGLRVKKVAGGTTTVYIFSGAKVIAEYVNGAAVTSPTREYIYSGGALVATHEGSSLKFQMSDHLSARIITDTSGNVLEQKGHFPYGELWYAKDGAGNNITPGKWQFTSYERDAESGNDYAIFRYHMNRFGRFSQPDPVSGSLANPQSLNRYAYVLNDPINFDDPLGLQHRPGRERVGGFDRGDGYRFGGWPFLPAGWNSLGRLQIPVYAYGPVWGVTDRVYLGTNLGSDGIAADIYLVKYGLIFGWAEVGSLFLQPPLPPRGEIGPPGGGDSESNGDEKTVDCFVKGAAVGAAGALAVGAVTVGAVALGAPVAAVTGALGAAAVIGAVALYVDSYAHYATDNSAGLAYNAGSLVGGLLAGGLGGRAIASGIRSPASSGWGWRSWVAQRFRPSLGSLTDWLGTGPTGAAGGVAAGWGGTGVAAAANGGC